MIIEIVMLWSIFIYAVGPYWRYFKDLRHNSQIFQTYDCLWKFFVKYSWKIIQIHLKHAFLTKQKSFWFCLDLFFFLFIRKGKKCHHDDLYLGKNIIKICLGNSPSYCSKALIKLIYTINFVNNSFCRCGSFSLWIS